jgi:ribosomal protein L7/L12
MTLLILVGIGLALVLVGAAISNRKTKNLRDAGIYPEAGKEKEEDVLRLLKSGDKIMAIKCYREIHKIGLKEAKDAVELLEKNHGA